MSEWYLGGSSPTGGPLIRLVNTVSACRILKVSRATLYRYMAKGLLKFEVRSGHRLVRL